MKPTVVRLTEHDHEHARIIAHEHGTKTRASTIRLTLELLAHQTDAEHASIAAARSAARSGYPRRGIDRF